MHLTLTDHLICPKCGPDMGLIVLAERMANRRILEGALGCPNCRRQYVIHNGVADLRTQEPEPSPSLSPSPGEGKGRESDVAFRLAALLGLTDGKGYALLLGGAGLHAAAIAQLVPGLELIVMNDSAQGGAEEEGVNRLLSDTVLPLRDQAVRGAVVGAGTAVNLLQDVQRVIAVGGRLIIARALEEAETFAHANGVRELARDGDHIVVLRVV